MREGEGRPGHINVVLEWRRSTGIHGQSLFVLKPSVADCASFRHDNGLKINGSIASDVVFRDCYSAGLDRPVEDYVSEEQMVSSVESNVRIGSYPVR